MYKNESDKKQMTAEEYLERIEKIDTLIVNKWEDYLKWKAIASGFGTSGIGEGGISSSRNIDKTQNAIMTYMGIDDELEALKKERKEIIGNIEKLPILEYNILYAFYVSRLKIKEIAHKLKISYDSVKKRKKIGLKLIQAIIVTPKDTQINLNIPQNT